MISWSMSAFNSLVPQPRRVWRRLPGWFAMSQLAPKASSVPLTTRAVFLARCWRSRRLRTTPLQRRNGSCTDLIHPKGKDHMHVIEAYSCFSCQWTQGKYRLPLRGDENSVKDRPDRIQLFIRPCRTGSPLPHLWNSWRAIAAIASLNLYTCCQ